MLSQAISSQLEAGVVNATLGRAVQKPKFLIPGRRKGRAHRASHGPAAGSVYDVAACGVYVVTDAYVVLVVGMSIPIAHWKQRRAGMMLT